ncbi:TadE/TadG family type IV pilus assembly protein [Phreatobacter oligotrophus]|uniref:Flp pilus assembly protein TadG n=1 Tax=Phreatobacter oligotrophus TaxID=1122261 RepID=A0A2T4YS43_9HYPH|nr:TadE/TadG family type IV pilus assembly protein [Phreatobacter oligotrophus]PTM46460.1 Flp pilus assembly protein TadG [Phreatobacter oligotrophus]
MLDRPACRPFSLRRGTILSRRLAGLARTFRLSRAGNVAIMFALALPPLLGVVGSAVDYTYAARAKSKLDSVADIAALTGVKIASTVPTAAVAKTNATASFNANTETFPRVTVNSVNITVSDNGLVRSSSVTYTATVQNAFMGLFGYSTLQIAGSSTASSNLPTYIDFYLLLDNTPSMGIGATPADVQTMVNNTSDQCGLACHDLSNSNGYYQLAKQLKVTMRIDVVRAAAQQLMDTAQATQVVSGQFRAAIYTYGDSCTALGATEITSLTTNLSNAKAKAGNIDLMTIPYQGYNDDQCTDNTASLSAVNKLIATPGDGSTAGAPQKVLMLVADGVSDASLPSTCTRALSSSTRCQEPLNPAICDTIKNRGIRIAVLYTTYLPLTTNWWYNQWIAPFQSTIGTKMQNCASPGLYFEVSPTQGIADAMTALFKKAIATARLTQ